MGYYRQREQAPELETFAELCRLIFDRTDVRRIRLSSLEPQTLKGDFLQLCRESDGRLCRHFHVSLQSGSSRVLRLMHRPYDRDTYIRLVSDVKDARPNTIIGADVIVGFPGETEDDFHESVTLAESGLIDYLHVFSYSDRRGTLSSELPDKVKPHTIKERNAVLSGISDDLRMKANRRQVGETLDVIAEYRKIDGRFHWGVSDNYIRVRLPDAYEGGKEIVRVKVARAFQEHVEGDLVGPPSGNL